MKNFFRNCPEYNAEMKYANRGILLKFEKKRILCKQCRVSPNSCNCPKCDAIMEFGNQAALKNAKEQKLICLVCREKEAVENNYIRLYPGCNVEIKYSRVDTFYWATRKNLKCRSCKNVSKTKQCERCNVDMTYKAHAKDLYKPCRNIVREEEAGTRKCPNCKIVVTYKTKWDRQVAEENNSVRKCVGAVNKKLKQGKTIYDIWIEKGVDPKQAMLDYENILETNLIKRTDKLAQGLYTTAGSERFEIAGLMCQGNWERMYIENLVNKKEFLPTKPQHSLKHHLDITLQILSFRSFHRNKIRIYL